MPKGQTVVNLSTFTTFGDLLRYLRERARLTQRELAAQVGYHFSYISYLEKNLRLPEEAVLLARFVPALEIEDEPNVVSRLLELASYKPKKSLIPEHPAEAAVRVETARGLPPSLTSMLGRECETEAIYELLCRAEVRLITIVGPPGVGKTRLALHVAERQNTFVDGVVFVDLTPVTQAELVLSAIATVLNETRSDPGSLKPALQNKNLLMVIDNFEQVMDAAPQLIPLLGGAPGLKIIVTSREALRLRGEYEFPLSPLPVSTDSLLDSPAVQLFFERARAVQPDFPSDEETASRVAEICRRLDGLPLAIELAAARVRTLSLSAMLEQFDRRFEWLTRGGRDLPLWRQNLWSAINWSYALLSGQERALFNRLSVFAGGWTLEAAEAVCSDDVLCARSDIFNLLMQLVDKSLVVPEPQGDRYSLLETLRQYAREKLQEGGELERIRQLHCEYFLKFTQDVRPHLQQGGEQGHWLNLMSRDHNNLRAALTWVTETPARAAMALDFGKAIQLFWQTRSHISEARQWLDRILALDSTPSLIRADLMRYASDYASGQGDYEVAQGYEEQSMEISRILGDEVGVYYSMDGMAMLAGMQGNYARTAELLEEVLCYWRKTNDSVRLTATLNNLAIASRRLGNLERAKELYAEAIGISRNNGNLYSLGHPLLGLAEVHVELKEFDKALPLQRESLAIRHQMGALKGLAFSLSSLAITFYYLNENLLAVQLESVSEKIRHDLGLVVPPTSRADKDALHSELRSRLGETAFDCAWSSAREMPLDEVVTLAMGDSV